MFKQLFDLMSDRDVITISVTKVSEKLSVSVIPNKVGLKDDAKNLLKPIVITGTPKDFDNDFVSSISTPLQKTFGIMTNMAEYEKSVEEMQANPSLTVNSCISLLLNILQFSFVFLCTTNFFLF